MGDILEDMLVTPSQCAGKYITYTSSLAIHYFHAMSNGRQFPSTLQQQISVDKHR